MADTTRRCPQFEPMFLAYGLPVKIFSYIAWRESKCVTRAAGWNYHPGASHLDCPSGVFDRHIRCEAVKSADIGLLQINSTWRTVTRNLCGDGVDRSIELLFDPDCNLSVARHLYDRGGLVHWTPTTGRDASYTPVAVTTIELPAGPVSSGSAPSGTAAAVKADEVVASSPSPIGLLQAGRQPRSVPPHTVRRTPEVK